MVGDNLPESSQIMDSRYSPGPLFRDGLQALLHALLGMKGDYSCQLRISPQSADGIKVLPRLDEPCLRDRLHTSTPSLATSFEKALPKS
jgi:hypothetical protein